MTCDPQSLLDAARCFSCIPAGMLASVGTNLLCQLTNRPGGVECTDPQVDDWLARIGADAAAILPPDNIIDAVCIFCHDLRAAGIFNKMLVVNPIIPPTDGTPASLRAMMHPLIYVPGNTLTPLTNIGFVVADLNVNGLLGDGMSKYIDTGFFPAGNPWGAFADDKGGLTVYQSEARQAFNDGNEECELGCYDGDLGLSHFLSCECLQNPLNPTLLAYDWSGATAISINYVRAMGFYSANRTSAMSFQAYQASSTIACHLLGQNLGDNTGNPPPNRSAYFMAKDDDGPPSQFTTKRISFLAIHEGLTQIEACALYNAVQKMRISFGGGFA